MQEEISGVINRIDKDINFSIQEDCNLILTKEEWSNDISLEFDPDNLDELYANLSNLLNYIYIYPK